MTHPGLTNCALTPTLSVSKEWIALGADERTERVKTAFSKLLGYLTVSIVRVELTAVIVAFNRGGLNRMSLSPSTYGKELMALECDLRTMLGEPLEVYCEFKVDRNPQRSEIQARVTDWRARREESKRGNLGRLGRDDAGT